MQNIGSHDATVAIVAMLQSGMSKGQVINTFGKLMGATFQERVAIVRPRVEAVQESCRLVDGQILEYVFGEGFCYSNSDRSISITPDFLARCAPEHDKALREAMRSIMESSEVGKVTVV